MIRYVAAALIIAGCGGMGLAMCAGHRREVTGLRQLAGILDFMQCQLQYRMTPLPELCGQVSE